jgi:hypothetical protein
MTENWTLTEDAGKTASPEGYLPKGEKWGHPASDFLTMEWSKPGLWQGKGEFLVVQSGERNSWFSVFVVVSDLCDEFAKGRIIRLEL